MPKTLGMTMWRICVVAPRSVALTLACPKPDRNGSEFRIPILVVYGFSRTSRRAPRTARVTCGRPRHANLAEDPAAATHTTFGAARHVVATMPRIARRVEGLFSAVEPVCRREQRLMGVGSRVAAGC
jgi:hypothetical protein